MTSRTRRGCAQWLVFPVSLVAAAHAADATVKEVMPPPGLYQIDSDTTFTRPGQKLELKQHRDGATGAEHEQTTVQGQVSTTDTPGKGPVTQCIKPFNGNVLPGLAAAQCPKQSQKLVGDKTLLHTAQCPDSKFTMEVTKVDDKHWQFVTRTETAVMPSPAATVGGMEAILKLQAQYAATPQERAEAKKNLAAMPAQKKQLEQRQASDLQDLKGALAHTKDPQERAMLEKTIASMSGADKTDTQVEVDKARWTRIADSCGAAH